MTLLLAAMCYFIQFWIWLCNVIDILSTYSSNFKGEWTSSNCVSRALGAISRHLVFSHAAF